MYIVHRSNGRFNIETLYLKAKQEGWNQLPKENCPRPFPQFFVCGLLDKIGGPYFLTKLA